MISWIEFLAGGRTIHEITRNIINDNSVFPAVSLNSLTIEKLPTVPSLEHFKEIIATYQRHGWELKRVLIKPDTRNELLDAEVFSKASLRDGEFDGLWFARPSQRGREAWELRLVAENPYALFAAFEPDETEEEREEARLEMEHQMREQAGSGSVPPAAADA